MAPTVRFHAKVSGYVQGVSFRYYTLRQAQTLALTGFVRNQDDGSVEVVAEGEQTDADKLLAWLHAGPPAAEVVQVQVQWQKPQGKFKRFEVLA